MTPKAPSRKKQNCAKQRGFYHGLEQGTLAVQLSLTVPRLLFGFGSKCLLVRLVKSEESWADPALALVMGKRLVSTNPMFHPIPRVVCRFCSDGSRFAGVQWRPPLGFNGVLGLDPRAVLPLEPSHFQQVCGRHFVRRFRRYTQSPSTGCFPES